MIRNTFATPFSSNPTSGYITPSALHHFPFGVNEPATHLYTSHAGLHPILVAVGANTPGACKVQAS